MTFPARRITLRTVSSPVAALWRLRSYLRPYRFQLIGMIAAALVAECAEIAIPLLIKVVIDGAIAHHDRALLIPLGLAAIGLGAAASTLSLIRRWVQGNAVTDMANQDTRPSKKSGDSPPAAN